MAVSSNSIPMPWGQGIMHFERSVEGTDFLSSKFRMHPITSDTMEPSMRRGDFAVCVPVMTWTGEGIYIIEDGGDTEIWRVCRTGDDQLRLTHDHEALRDRPLFVSVEWFNEHVVGVTVAHIRVTDSARLRRAIAA